MPRPALTFTRFLEAPENRAAWVAVRQVTTKAIDGPHAPRHEKPARARARAHGPPEADDSALALPRLHQTAGILLLHGPAGAGKSHLVHALAAEVLEHRPDFIVTVLAAGDLMRPTQPNLFSNEGEGEEAQQPADWTAELEEARHCDLLIVEDLQHLNPGAAELLVQTIDYLAARNRPMVLTANAGPQRLRHRGDRFPIRLVNRLAGGLVIGLDPLGPASRLKLMQMLAQRRQLAVPTEVLRWLSERLNGGGRQLEGAIAQLQTLAKLHRGPLDIATVAGQFQQQTDAGRVTVERIAERVGGYFRVALSQTAIARPLPQRGAAPPGGDVPGPATDAVVLGGHRRLPGRA